MIKLAYKNIDATESYFAEAVEVCFEYLAEQYCENSVKAAKAFLHAVAEYDNAASGPVTVLPYEFTKACGLNW